MRRWTGAAVVIEPGHRSLEVRETQEIVPVLRCRVYSRQISGQPIDVRYLAWIVTLSGVPIGTAGRKPSAICRYLDGVRRWRGTRAHQQHQGNRCAPVHRTPRFDTPPPRDRAQQRPVRLPTRTHHGPGNPLGIECRCARLATLERHCTPPAILCNPGPGHRVVFLRNSLFKSAGDFLEASVQAPERSGTLQSMSCVIANSPRSSHSRRHNR